MKKITLMHEIFGKGAGVCGECNNLEECYGHQKKYFKCRIYGDSNSAATDWSKSWNACGIKNQEPRGAYPIFKQKGDYKKPQEQVPGQMVLTDFM